MLSLGSEGLFAESIAKFSIFGRGRFDCQRMNGTGQFLSQSLIDETMTLHERNASEHLRHDFHPEMAFSTRPGTRMTCMKMGLIDDFKRQWGEHCRQFIINLLFYCTAHILDPYDLDILVKKVRLVFIDALRSRREQSIVTG